MPLAPIANSVRSVNPTAVAVHRSGQEQQPPERCIQIWERSEAGLLSLHATAEPAAALLPLLAWQPNGRHLFTVHAPAGPSPGTPAAAGAGPLSPQRSHQRAHAVLGLAERDSHRDVPPSLCERHTLLPAWHAEGEGNACAAHVAAGAATLAGTPNNPKGVRASARAAAAAAAVPIASSKAALMSQQGSQATGAAWDRCLLHALSPHHRAP